MISVEFIQSLALRENVFANAARAPEFAVVVDLNF